VSAPVICPIESIVTLPRLMNICRGNSEWRVRTLVCFRPGFWHLPAESQSPFVFLCVFDPPLPSWIYLAFSDCRISSVESLLVISLNCSSSLTHIGVFFIFFLFLV
jgi:hypothetical protein